jgi:hypothetical protein
MTCAHRKWGENRPGAGVQPGCDEAFGESGQRTEIRARRGGFAAPVHVNPVRMA